MLRLMRFSFALIFPLLLVVGVMSVGVTSTVPVHAQSQSDFSAIDSTINSLMTLYHVPGVALGIVQNGQVVYTKGYGYRDYQAKLPVTPKTVFAVGSISKSFTALDVGQLVDQGKIDLSAPV